MSINISWVKWFRPYRIIILLLILFAFFFRIPLLEIRYFDPDEFQHLHGAHQIYHGQIPYRDYFDHHTPLLHFILSALYPIFGEEIDIVFAARWLMMVFTAAILYLTYLLTRMLYKDDTGLIAVLFLSYVLMFLEKTIEIRPDVPAVALWLASLIFMVKGIRRNSASFSPLWFLFSGLCIGTAIMFTQKSLFAFNGLIITLIWMFLDPRKGFTRMRSLKLAGIFLGSVLIPIILVCIFFYANGGLSQFIDYNFIMNSQWKLRFGPYDYIRRMISQNPFFPVTGLLGLFIASYWMRKRENIANGSFAPVLSTYALITGLFIMPVPYRQYYQLFVPLLAMYSGMLLVKISEADFSNLKNRPGLLIITTVVAELAITGIIYTLSISKPGIFKVKLLFPIVLTALIVSTIPLFIFDKRKYIPLIIAIGIIIHPFNLMIGQLSQKNTDQLENIKYIMEITTPEDTVLDGWSGFGFLRPHAYFYYFLHPEMRAMLSEKQLSDDIIQNLEEKQTKVVIYDSQIKALPKKVQEYIEANYVISNKGDIYVRVERNAVSP
jgi:4-amino-4-deoxy-L-arabinose transferase-like glycosyltransferase